MDGATIKIKLHNETSLGTIGSTNKLYAVGVDSNGKLSVSVPWEDTHYNANITVGAKNTSNNDVTKNEETHLKLFENEQLRSQIKIYGSGLTEVGSNVNGDIVIDTDLSAEDIENALGYVPEGFVLVTFVPQNENSNILAANFSLSELLHYANQNMDIRGCFDIDDITIYVTPCLISETGIIFIGQLGQQIIAIAMAEDIITVSEAEFVTPEHTHEITYVPLGSVS
jgi:hypothetical protein